MDVKENSSSVQNSEIIFKAMQVKTKDDFKIKVTENISTTSYFMGKGVVSQ